jgi:hypothetical protein
LAVPQINSSVERHPDSDRLVRIPVSREADLRPETTPQGANELMSPRASAWPYRSARTSNTNASSRRTSQQTDRRPLHTVQESGTSVCEPSTRRSGRASPARRIFTLVGTVLASCGLLMVKAGQAMSAAKAVRPSSRGFAVMHLVAAAYCAMALHRIHCTRSPRY